MSIFYVSIDKYLARKDVLEGTLVVNTPEAWDCKAINIRCVVVIVGITPLVRKIYVVIAAFPTKENPFMSYWCGAGFVLYPLLL